MSGYTRSASAPYIEFCKAKRDEVRASNPTAKFGDMGRLLLAIWKEMSESEKAAYANIDENNVVASNQCEQGLRRSSRLRNKRLGINFFGNKL
jgi:hypothetical protein